MNGTIKNNIGSVQALFDEYARLTNLSGLRLNAEKTEVMRIKAGQVLEPASSFRINYLNAEFDIVTKQGIKINGITFLQDKKEMKDVNVDEALSKMNAIFKQWSRRSLSLLGKILIVKTFGISQLVYLLQSIVIENVHLKKINAMLYKYIWNRHYLAAKAPERIKREIMNTPILKGGFGMLDVAELDDSLKLRALGRILSSNHPLLSRLKEGIDWSDFLNVRLRTVGEEITSRGILLLNKERNKLGTVESLNGSRQLLALLRERPIRNLVNDRGRLSLAFFLVRQSGASKVKDLNEGQLTSLERFLDRSWLTKLKSSLRMRLPYQESDKFLFYDGKNLRNIERLSSKEFRASKEAADQLCVFKFGLILTPAESASWLYKVNKLTSVKHKSILLRLAHGEVYTRDKLYRYNLIENDRCHVCGETETLNHKFITCVYAQSIWEIVNNLNGMIPEANSEPEQIVLGAWLNSDKLNLTVRAEIIQRLSYQRDQNYVIRPNLIVKMAINSLRLKEENAEFKNLLDTLL